MPEANNVVRLPAAERLAATLADRVANGEYKSGDWLPTERELAVEFRANRSTVRAALSSLADRQMIVRRPGHRSRICDQPEQHADVFDPRPPAVSTQSLAIVVPQTPHYPASASIQRGILQVLIDRRAGYHLKVFDNWANTFYESVRRERLALESVRKEGISGVVLWHQGSVHTLRDIRHVRDAGIPIVLVDRRYTSLDTDFVGIDNVSASREATTYLLDLGHRRIMHLTMEGPTTTIRGREQGYRDALAARGIKPRPDWIYRLAAPVDMQPPASAAADYFLSLPELPTAIFVMNDLLAHSLMSELQARGCEVPEQISIMGFDNMDRNVLHSSPLTTVHQPFEQMGEKAVDLLLSRLTHPENAFSPTRHVLVPTKLVIRSSCRPISGNTQ